MIDHAPERVPSAYNNTDAVVYKAVMTCKPPHWQPHEPMTLGCQTSCPIASQAPPLWLQVRAAQHAQANGPPTHMQHAHLSRREVQARTGHTIEQQRTGMLVQLW